MEPTSVMGIPRMMGLEHGAGQRAAGLLAALSAVRPAAATEVHLRTGTGGGGALWWLLLLAPLAVALYLLVRRDAKTPGSHGPPATSRDEPDAARFHDLSFYEETFRSLVSSFPTEQGDRERSYMEVIGAMVATAHARDHETIGHSFRVARYAVALARRVGINEETLSAVEWGALLHDVGKIGVPERVLRKRGPLTEPEMAVMREHPRRGYQMLKGLLFLGTGLDIVLSHHERWDGTGYPNGLSGERIPLSARIFSVVDTYDAITSDRPYRAARSHREAAAELRRVSGSQLDPEVVERFLEIPEQELADLQDLTREVDSDIDAAVHKAVLDLPDEPLGRRPLARLEVSG